MASNYEGQYNNPSYRLTISGTGVSSVSDQTRIDAYLPESISFSLTSEWESLLNSFVSALGGTGKAGDMLVSMDNIMGTLSGHRSLITQVSTFPAWKGNGPLEFSIPFVFNAVEDAGKDVLSPIITLLKLAAPSAQGLLLEAPGPTFKIDKDNSQINFDQKKILNLSVGRFLYIRGIIITGVANTIVSKFDIAGRPMAAQVDVSMRTAFSPTQEDIIHWFNYDTQYFQGSNYLDWNQLKQSAKNSMEEAYKGLKSVGGFAVKSATSLF